MKKVSPDKRRKVWESALTYQGFRNHKSYINRIYVKYTSEEDRMRTLADIYVYSRPDSSCLHFLDILYREDEFEATKELKSFMEKFGMRN